MSVLGDNGMQPTYQWRVVCTGTGRKHQNHRYVRETSERAEWEVAYLDKQTWTKECRPHHIEKRVIGEWEKT